LVSEGWAEFIDALKIEQHPTDNEEGPEPKGYAQAKKKQATMPMLPAAEVVVSPRKPER
jgi:hypothetical protein